MEDVVKALLETNAKLVEQIVELTRVIAELKAPQPSVSMEGVDMFPLRIPETVEDARFARDNGLISTEDYQKVLKELDFFNSEITFPEP
jgi:hypothetical protein